MRARSSPLPMAIPPGPSAGRARPPPPRSASRSPSPAVCSSAISVSTATSGAHDAGEPRHFAALGSCRSRPPPTCGLGRGPRAPSAHRPGCSGCRARRGRLPEPSTSSDGARSRSWSWSCRPSPRWRPRARPSADDESAASAPSAASVLRTRTTLTRSGTLHVAADQDRGRAAFGATSATKSWPSKLLAPSATNSLPRHVRPRVRGDAAHTFAASRATSSPPVARAISASVNWRGSRGSAWPSALAPSRARSASARRASTRSSKRGARRR